MNIILAINKLFQKWFHESINYLCPKKEAAGETSDESKQASGSSVCWLNKLCIQKVSNKFSRTNAPSRASQIPKLIRSSSYSNNQHILVSIINVCKN